MLREQIESSLASKDEQLKQLEQKKESDMEAARAVLSFFPPYFRPCCGALIAVRQVLHNSVDNVEIAHAMVTLIR